MDLMVMHGKINGWKNNYGFWIELFKAHEQISNERVKQIHAYTIIKILMAKQIGIHWIYDNLLMGLKRYWHSAIENAWKTWFYRVKWNERWCWL